MALPELILIHGYPFDHTMWNPVVAALKNKTKVFTPDLPGFGDNPVATVEPSLAAMADDIADFFTLHGLRRAVVCGMSMGGYVALAFAQRHRERLAGLGLISTQTLSDNDETKQARRELIEKVRHQGIQPAIDALLPKMFFHENEKNASLKKYLIDGVEGAGVDGICWALEAMARRPDQTRLLNELNETTLILHGAEDKLIPPERIRKLAGNLKNAIYREISTAGHATPLEAPEEVASALIELLEKSEKELHRVPKHDPYADRLPGIIWAPSEHGL